MTPVSASYVYVSAHGLYALLLYPFLYVLGSPMDNIPTLYPIQERSRGKTEGTRVISVLELVGSIELEIANLCVLNSVLRMVDFTFDSKFHDFLYFFVFFCIFCLEKNRNFGHFCVWSIQKNTKKYKKIGWNPPGVYRLSNCAKISLPLMISRFKLFLTTNHNFSCFCQLWSILPNYGHFWHVPGILSNFNGLHRSQRLETGRNRCIS
eukprot:sb/3470333/